ncbi:hydroxyethylthiazole kinase [Bombilactobacillus folatiphilus]|uniref:Hydroxyethylthiazole kinase n=1 Tax=Bombilactobacillus folatiphilus TaxID=2923362 RepID=A0ABY4P8X5_9LACO|nr:hydroxyethylthiazole kinase [Bombilactobacillus folatiphilus]UQS82045.1 hydroxyethylthiazole kinase [Bombilactobacillus folatiphilus]
MKLSLLNKLREVNPVILNLSNFVTVQDVANGLNALGASPIMSEEIAETDEMVKICNAVALNLGAFTQAQITHLRAMGKQANQAHKPVVLDPVAVAAITYRKQVALELLNQFQVNVIRGNAGEIAALAGFDWQAHGIDAGGGSSDLTKIAQVAAQKFHCTILLSGATDIITDGQRVTKVSNGTPLFATHVGSGDMLSSIVAAFLAVADGDDFQAAAVAALVFACIGELTASQEKKMGSGTFIMRLLDQLQFTTIEQITKIARYREVETDDKCE